MSTNDYLTLSISLLALVVSIASAVAAYRQQGTGLRTTIRDQLTTIIQELITTQADMEVVRAERDYRPDPMNVGKSAMLNHKLTSLARQACELNRLQPNVAFDVELIAVASALATSGDLPLAEQYFKQAIQKAPSGYYKLINLSLYANFLFEQSRQAEGREAYRESLAILDDSSDFNRWANGSTYRSWFSSEMLSGDPSALRTADGLYQQAEALFRGIKAPGMRDAAIRDLEAARGVQPS